MLNRKQVAILAIGGSITLGIGAFYVIKDRTSLLLPKPLICKSFPTKDPRHPGEIEICINGVSSPFVPANGDVELDITFMRSTRERVQADVVVWVADNIFGRQVDYTGEMNFSRVRLYEDNILAAEHNQKFSVWTNPIFPADVHISLWKWIHANRYLYDRTRLPLDEKLHALLKSSINLVSVAVSAGLTVWRVLKAQG